MAPKRRVTLVGQEEKRHAFVGEHVRDNKRLVRTHIDDSAVDTGARDEPVGFFSGTDRPKDRVTGPSKKALEIEGGDSVPTGDKHLACGRVANGKTSPGAARGNTADIGRRHRLHERRLEQWRFRYGPGQGSS